MASEEPTPPLGIDLGTTFSVVGVFRGRKPEIVADFETSKRTIPSCVSFSGSSYVVGQAAKDILSMNTLYDAKRLIGRPYDEVDEERDLVNWPFAVRCDGGMAKYEIERDGIPVLLPPELVSAKVLEKMKLIAETYCLETTVKQAVVTVPAYFSESQRQATKCAGIAAGLDVLALLTEPAAAAIAYSFRDANKEGTVLIFDLGGGTFDVAVVSLLPRHEVRVLAYGGDTHLGGQDFDCALLDYVIQDIKKTLNVNVRDDPDVLHELRRNCELAKTKLSTQPETPLNCYLNRANKNYRTTISRATFEELCMPLFKKALDMMPDVLERAKVPKEDIDEIVLVGGSTRIPKVQAMVRNFFGKEPVKSLNPDEVVAQGAAIWAAKLAGIDGTGQVRLRDMASLSLGVAAPSGDMAVLIRQGRALPATSTKTFTTIRDDQDEAEFRVCQGVHAKWAANHQLGVLTLAIPARRRGTVDMEATFMLDASGILKVTARERATGTAVDATFLTEGRASDRELQSLLTQAGAYKRRDE